MEHGLTSRRRLAAHVAGLMAAVVCVAAGPTAASASRVETASGSTIRIGLLVSSEGPFANNSATAQRGAEFAVQTLNDAGGVGGHPIELVVADSHGQPDQLATIIPRLATEDNVIAIVGPVESASCDVACPLALQHELPMVSPGAARPGVLEPGRPYTFSLAQPDAANSTPALGAIIADREITTAAIILDEANATTAAQADLFRATFEAAGVEVVDEVTYTSGDSSFAAQITQIASSEPDAIALAAGPADAGRIAVEVDAQGLESQLLGTGSLQSDINGFLEAAGDAAEGTLSAAQYNPNSPDPAVSELLAAGAEELGVDEVPLNFAYGYDAVNIIASIIEAEGLTGDSATLADDRIAIQEGLNGLEEFIGMADRTEFGDDGFSMRPILIAEIVDGEVVITEVATEGDSDAVTETTEAA